MMCFASTSFAKYHLACDRQAEETAELQTPPGQRVVAFMEETFQCQVLDSKGNIIDSEEKLADRRKSPYSYLIWDLGEKVEILENGERRLLPSHQLVNRCLQFNNSLNGLCRESLQIHFRLQNILMISIRYTSDNEEDKTYFLSIEPYSFENKEYNYKWTLNPEMTLSCFYRSYKGPRCTEYWD